MRKVLTLPVFALFAIAAVAQPAIRNPQPVPSPPPSTELSVTDAIILGVVEGVTEYLPVSSTGHLIIADHFLHLDADTPLRGREGEPLWYRKPSTRHPQGEPLTLKLAADTFVVVIQFGAIAAVALLYWPQLMAMLQGLRGRDPAGLRLLINIVIAFIPAAVIGLLLSRWIEEKLFSLNAVIAAQIGGAIFMLWAEAWRRRRDAARGPGATDLDTVTPRAALGVGALQCAALWPGMSRSMTTIVGGYFAGLQPRRAAEFSFLLGFVTLTAATIYKSYKSGGAMIQVFGWSHVLLGCIVATVTAAVCVRFLVHWLTRHGLGVFAWYRIAVALLLLALGSRFHL